MSVQFPPEELVDGNLLLHRFHPDDAESLHEATTSSLAQLIPWMPWATENYSRADSESFLKRTFTEWNDSINFNFAVVVDGRLCGSCGLMRRIGPGGLEIGYWLALGSTGQGFMTRAVRLLVRAAFDLGATHVQIKHEEENVKSGGIPKRLGFKNLGISLEANAADTAKRTVVWQLDREAYLASSMAALSGQPAAEDESVS